MPKETLNNVLDFTEKKLEKMIGECAKSNREDVAMALCEVLEQYLSEEVDVLWIDGLPYVKEREDGVPNE